VKKGEGEVLISFFTKLRLPPICYILLGASCTHQV